MGIRKTQTTNEIFLLSLNAVEWQHERGVSVPFHLRTVLENVNFSCFHKSKRKKLFVFGGVVRLYVSHLNGHLELRALVQCVFI